MTTTSTFAPLALFSGAFFCDVVTSAQEAVRAACDDCRSCFAEHTDDGWQIRTSRHDGVKKPPYVLCNHGIIVFSTCNTPTLFTVRGMCSRCYAAWVDAKAKGKVKK